MKKRTVMDDFYLAKSFDKTTVGERVPVPPPKLLPVRGLTLWKKIPYDYKHPLQPRPRIDSTFKSKEIGESLFESFPNKSFELSNCPPPSTVYNSLHDPYLRFFFRSTRVFRNLLHRGLVTLDGHVKMKLREFNVYREYLFRCWVYQVNQLIREEHEEEKKCYDKIYEAFEKDNKVCQDLFENEDCFEVDTFLAQLTVRLYNSRDLATGNPLIQSLVRWLQYNERLQTNYAEHYPVIRDWLRNQMRNKHMLEKKINIRRSRDNYLRARWENLKVNSEETHERVQRLQEEHRDKFQKLCARRLSRARKMWARCPSYRKAQRMQKNLASNTSVDKKAVRYSKSVNLSEDWDPTPDDFAGESPTVKIKLEIDTEQDDGYDPSSTYETIKEEVKEEEPRNDPTADEDQEEGATEADPQAEEKSQESSAESDVEWRLNNYFDSLEKVAEEMTESESPKENELDVPKTDS